MAHRGKHDMDEQLEEEQEHSTPKTEEEPNLDGEPVYVQKYTMAVEG